MTWRRRLMLYFCSWLCVMLRPRYYSPNPLSVLYSSERYVGSPFNIPVKRIFWSEKHGSVSVCPSTTWWNWRWRFCRIRVSLAHPFIWRWCEVFVNLRMDTDPWTNNGRVWIEFEMGFAPSWALQSTVVGRAGSILNLKPYVLYWSTYG